MWPIWHNYVLKCSWRIFLLLCPAATRCVRVGYSQGCYADWLEPRSDSPTVTQLQAQKEPFTASLHAEGPLSSRCYTALCTNVDYSGCCYADCVEPQELCWWSWSNTHGCAASVSAVQQLVLHCWQLKVHQGVGFFVENSYWFGYGYIMSWKLSHRLGPKVPFHFFTVSKLMHAAGHLEKMTVKLQFWKLCVRDTQFSFTCILYSCN